MTPAPLTPLRSVYGVDFSGAKLAGHNIWVARAEPTGGPLPLRLVGLHNLAVLAGTAERGPALAHLVHLIRTSRGALWGMDVPFGLPVELFDHGTTWRQQLATGAGWDGEAYGLGLWCVDRARRIGHEMHVRRTTDTDARTPFDWVVTEACPRVGVQTSATTAPELQAAGRTTVLTSHRPSLIRAADVAYVIEDGRVTESGRPDELAQRGGYLARFLALTLRPPRPWSDPQCRPAEGRPKRLCAAADSAGLATHP